MPITELNCRLRTLLLCVVTVGSEGTLAVVVLGALPN